MDPEYLIVLYSKYSNQCKTILQLYDEMLMPNIKLVCIDNAKIRQRLSIQNIKTVPCVLFMYPGNRLEKFEGPTVSNWLLEKMKAFNPSVNQTIESSALPVQLSPVRIRSRTKRAPPPEEEVEDIEDITYIEDVPPKSVSPSPSSKRSSVSSSKRPSVPSSVPPSVSSLPIPSEDGVTDIESLMEMPSSFSSSSVASSIPSSSSLSSSSPSTSKVKKEKTLAEKAAEMAAAREGADKPVHLQLQEQHHRQIEASMNGNMI